MNAQKYKRRNYFINKEFQGRTIFSYFILVLIGSVLFAAIFSFFSANTLSIVYDNYHLKLGTTPGILMEKIFSAQWFFIILGGGAVILITLFLTHRVAGPFYRFEKSLDDMLGGDISGKIHLRQKDEGKVLARKINEFNTLLAERLSRIEALNRRIEFDAGRIESEEQPTDTIREIQNSAREISDILNKFYFVREDG